MNPVRQIAFGYSTKCNIRCEHCVASDGSIPQGKMILERAMAIIEQMALCHVTGISFTAGEPLIFFEDMNRLVRQCHEKGIYSRVVTNCFWAKTSEHADDTVSALSQSGLSQLRLSFSRWHQKHIRRENVVTAARSCQKHGLDYFVSFVSDFSRQDDSLEQFLRDNRLKFFPEPIIYLGRAQGFTPERILTDYYPNTCPMNPYLSPELNVFACCDGGSRFDKTDFLFLGNLKDHGIEELFKRKENNVLFHLIRTMGLTNIASYLGFKASEIVQYRKCELCEKLFNSTENLNTLEKAATSDLLNWKR